MLGAKRLRPEARRRAMIFLPSFVLILLRKPCFLRRFTLLFLTIVSDINFSVIIAYILYSKAKTILIQIIAKKYRYFSLKFNLATWILRIIRVSISFPVIPTNRTTKILWRRITSTTIWKIHIVLCQLFIPTYFS